MDNNIRRQILEEAEKCVCTDRQTAYGTPENNFTRQKADGVTGRRTGQNVLGGNNDISGA